MDVARRLKVGVAALVALMGCAFFAAPALADTQPDPTESNIPYLAWRGEQVRLVKCAPSITGIGQRADFLLVDWSGEENSLAIPQMEGSTAGFFVATGRDHAGQGCVGATFTSQKAGIAQIKLVVSQITGTPYTAGGVGFLPGGNVVGLAGTAVLKHDFLAAWMNLNTPVLSVANPPGPLGDVPAGGFPTPGADVLTDPAGAGPNNFRVDVTGNIPLRADFRELGLGDTLQMPQDWPRLAVAMGTFFNPDNPAPGGLWDIHDNRATDEGHGFQSVCPPYSTGTAAVAERAAHFDAVDNCPQVLLPNGTYQAPSVVPPNPALFPNTPQALNGEFGAFSRIWQNPTNPTIGPFDPLKPSETLLSNGVLDANDAPMPAARIDFTTTGGGFFGCVGSIGPTGQAVNGPGGAGCNSATGPLGFIARSPTGALSFLPAGAFCGPPGATANVPGWTCVPLGPALLPNQAAKDKHVIYSRTHTGAVTALAPNEHNLYAPFYGRFIPSTSRATQFPCAGGVPGNPVGCDPRLPFNATPNSEASGEDGPSGSVLDNTSPSGGGCSVNTGGTACVNIGTNDFNGWLVNGLYHYWDIARVLNNAAVAPSSCLLRFVTTFGPIAGATTPGTLGVTRVAVPRPLSSGPQTVAVYTDEHGEAHVNWYPGVGFSFAGLASNLNAGCDVTGNLATPVIQAIARYPYQPVTAPPLLSNTFTKTVTSLFAKQLQCAPKGTGVNDQFSQICVISAKDITGSPVPFAGEIVCFASTAELIQHFHNEVGSGLPVLPAALGGGTVNGTLLTPAEVAALGKSGAAVLCQRLDVNGRAAVEVFGKGPSNVLVDLVDEGLIRALAFNFGPPSSATGTSEAVSSTAPATSDQIAAVNNSTGTTVALPSGNITNTAGSKPEVTAGATVPGTKAAPKYTMAFSPQIITPANGRPYLKVRVNGPKGNVRIQVAYLGAKKTVKTFKRTIATNKVVLIKNLPTISAAVRSYRVTIAG